MHAFGIDCETRHVDDDDHELWMPFSDLGLWKGHIKPTFGHRLRRDDLVRLGEILLRAFNSGGCSCFARL